MRTPGEIARDLLAANDKGNTVRLSAVPNFYIALVRAGMAEAFREAARISAAEITPYKACNMTVLILSKHFDNKAEECEG